MVSHKFTIELFSDTTDDPKELVDRFYEALECLEESVADECECPREEAVVEIAVKFEGKHEIILDAHAKEDETAEKSQPTTEHILEQIENLPPEHRAVVLKQLDDL